MCIFEKEKRRGERTERKEGSNCRRILVISRPSNGDICCRSLSMCACSPASHCHAHFEPRPRSVAFTSLQASEISAFLLTASLPLSHGSTRSFLSCRSHLRRHLTSSSFHLESFPLPTPTNPLFAPFDYITLSQASIWSFALYSGRRSFLQTYTHTHTLTHSLTHTPTIGTSLTLLYHNSLYLSFITTQNRNSISPSRSFLDPRRSWSSS